MSEKCGEFINEVLVMFGWAVNVDLNVMLILKSQEILQILCSQSGHWLKISLCVFAL